MHGSPLLTRPTGAAAPTGRPSPPATGRPPRPPLTWPEVAVAVAGFGVLCALVLTKATAMLEPDDYAYQASIVALSQGHVLLTTAQYHALSQQLGDGGSAIIQWVHLPDGRWISQKNPGYPFLAVAFQLLGVLRLAPLFYGAVASAGLFVGARRWLGRWGGTIAVLLFCTSGAAVTFAWRPTMETFTDASLVAAGAGLLLWAMLAVEASGRRRFLAGLGAFGALEAATFARYTDVLELGVAVLAVLVFARRARLPWRTVGGWLLTVALFAALVLTFDAVVYGGPLSTGYAAGLITFSLSAVLPNVAFMPARLVEAMPMAVVAAVAAVWIGARWLAPAWDATGDPATLGDLSERRRDGAVGLSLLAGWVAIWGLYLAYTWTVGQAGADPVHVVRFYLPALGPLALLGAWALVRLPVAAWAAAVLVLLGLGTLSFHVLSASGAGPGRFGPGLGGAGGGLPGAGGGPPGSGGGLPGAGGGPPPGFTPPG